MYGVWRRPFILQSGFAPSDMFGCCVCWSVVCVLENFCVCRHKLLTYYMCVPVVHVCAYGADSANIIRYTTQALSSKISDKIMCILDVMKL